ncbi:MULTISPECIES: acyl carrier protein [Chryseobacterium]|jgi:acyl carrier protein|uniref:Acyl carrier protein n=1 Tax=Chryseobacterium culicis TaxID=680127 RepID=A0A1H6HF88_CHRCI|nr:MULTISPECIES: acyl carrier protein [Chryseobacterium]MBE4948806.1 acyl carrier protein [Chryseobacterium culicis]QUY57499.1 acyl carrier protein [Chryseobacterium arthrosphaerae]SEH32924.1 Acyl carrier protein [Chryseobacterium culicis]
MNTTEEFYEIIASAIAIKKELVDEQLTYQEIPEWDSMSHLLIVEALEQFYQIKFDFNDILEMGTVGKIREKMKKYEVFVEN